MPRRASLPEGKSLFFRKPADDAAAQRGDEPEDGRATRQSAIFLEERHIDWLEDKCREARHNGGPAIRKAAVIRALLDVAIESPLTLTGLRNPEDITDRVRAGLKRLGETS